MSIISVIINDIIIIQKQMIVSNRLNFSLRPTFVRN